MKVVIVCFECETLRLTSEWDVEPVLYKIVRLRELPATLILPFNLIFNPLIFNSEKVGVKYNKYKYRINRKIDRVFQKLILNIMAFNQFANNVASRRMKLKCIICNASSKKNL